MIARSVLRVPRSWAAAALLALAMMAASLPLLFALSWLSLQVPEDLVRQRVQAAFANGTLRDDLYLPLDRTRGVHQFNDCLILTMVLLRDEDPLHSAISPLYMRGTPPRQASVCPKLRELANGADRLDYEESYYHRYLNAYRVATAALLPALSVEGIRTLLKGGSYALLAAVLAVAVARRNWPLAGIATALALFYGVEYFGMSPSHAFADWVVYGLLLYAGFRNLMDLTPVRFTAVVVAYASLCIWFEFLTGAVPMGLAVLTGVLGLHAAARDDWVHGTHRLLLGGGLFLATVGSALLLKQAIAAQVFGSYVWDMFNSRVAAHTGTEKDTPAMVWATLTTQMGHIGLGDAGVGHAAILAGLGVLGLSYMWIMLATRRPTLRLGATAVLLSAGVVAGWYLALPSHSIRHAIFMVRLCAWPIAAGLAMAGLAVAHQCRHMAR